MPNVPLMRNNRTEKKSAKKTVKFIGMLIKYCKKYWGIICVALVCAIASTVLAVIGPNKIADLTFLIEEGISINGIDINMASIAQTGITLVLIYAISMILNYAQGVIMNSVSCRVSKKLRTDITKKINVMPLCYFDNHTFGDTLSRLTNDVDMIGQSFTNSVSSLVSAAAMLIGCTIMMFITQPVMAVSAITASLIGFSLIALIMSKSQKYFNMRQESLAAVNGHVEEYFAGQNIVRAYNAENKAYKNFNRKNETLRKNTFKAEFLSSMMMPLMSFVGNLGYVAVCAVGAALAFGGTIDFSVVIAFILYVRLFTSPLSQIAQGMSSIQSAAAASERVFEFLGETELENESGKAAIITDVRGNVGFEHIKFGYEENKTIIHDFTLNINAGQKVAIVGPTGAGKTTIVNLLMRFYELNSGKITVDGIPISEVTRENVHSIFGMVLQDTWLFEGSVRDNLTYGKKLSDEELLKICEKCGLKHFIKTLPQGLDTVLNESVTMSAGQKQLLTIARAMAENAPLIILDEATSSVDTRTEQQIQNAMDKLTSGRTSFVIAHRLSTIRNADLIIYMQDGDIKETGTHTELLKRKGLYAELYNSQFMTA